MEIVTRIIIIVLACAAVILAFMLISEAERCNRLADLHLSAESKTEELTIALDKERAANTFLYSQLREQQEIIDTLENRLAIINLRAESEPEQEEPVPQALPETPWGEAHTNMYRCEDYRKITNLSSLQYKLLSECKASDSTGIMAYIDDNGEYYFCAALGGYFGYQIGDAWKFTLNNGCFFNVILSDFKHPIEQDNPETDYGDEDYNYLGDKCLNIIEFVIDSDKTPKKVLKAGTMSALEDFGGLYSYEGDIVSAEYLGRKWKNDKD